MTINVVLLNASLSLFLPAFALCCLHGTAFVAGAVAVLYAVVAAAVMVCVVCALAEEVRMWDEEEEQQQQESTKWLLLRPIATLTLYVMTAARFVAEMLCQCYDKTAKLHIA